MDKKNIIESTLTEYPPKLLSTSEEKAKLHKEKHKFSWFEIVENEWREEYEREWGLGIVVVVDKNDCYWVAKIMKDEKGYFIIPDVAFRPANRLRKTDRQIKEIPIIFENQITNHSHN